MNRFKGSWTSIRLGPLMIQRVDGRFQWRLSSSARWRSFWF